MRFLNGVERSSYTVRIFQKIKVKKGESGQTDTLEKFIQNYEISERSRRIVVHRSQILKNEEKKESGLKFLVDGPL